MVCMLPANKHSLLLYPCLSPRAGCRMAGEKALMMHLSSSYLFSLSKIHTVLTGKLPFDPPMRGEVHPLVIFKG